MNIKTANPIFAEYLGYTQPHPNYPKTTYWYKEGESPLVMLSFHTNWNWMMDVITKISEELHYSLNGTLEHLSDRFEKDGLYNHADVYEVAYLYITAPKIKKEKPQVPTITIQHYAGIIGCPDPYPTIKKVQDYAEDKLGESLWDYPLDELEDVQEEVSNRLVLVVGDGETRVCQLIEEYTPNK